MTTLTSENIPTNIGAVNADFAGREGSRDYDETKRMHIHSSNRAYVWNMQMQEKFLDSILKGYPIDNIYCKYSIVSVGNTYVERREVMEGGNRVTTIRRILNDEVRKLTPEEKTIVNMHSITVVVIKNATPAETTELFIRLNTRVRISDGQLYAMSKDSPLVKEAMSLLNDSNYPLRTEISEYFFDTQFRDSKGKPNLENAVALVSGVLHGPEFITRSYSRQRENLATTIHIDRERVIETLGHVFDVFRQANLIVNLSDGRRKKSQWAIGKYLGAILYDILMNMESIPQIQQKWATYLGKVRNCEQNAEDAIAVPGAQNLNVDRLYRMSRRVDVYLESGRILSKEELTVIRHPVQTVGDYDCESVVSYCESEETDETDEP